MSYTYSPPKVSTSAFFLAWYSYSSIKAWTAVSVRLIPEMNDNQTARPISSDVQSQLTHLSKEMKEMAASISTLVKAITPSHTTQLQ